MHPSKPERELPQQNPESPETSPDPVRGRSFEIVLIVFHAVLAYYCMIISIILLSNDNKIRECSEDVNLTNLEGARAYS